MTRFELPCSGIKGSLGALLNLDNVSLYNFVAVHQCTRRISLDTALMSNTSLIAGFPWRKRVAALDALSTVSARQAADLQITAVFNVPKTETSNLQTGTSFLRVDSTIRCSPRTDWLNSFELHRQPDLVSDKMIERALQSICFAVEHLIMQAARELAMCC